MSRSINRLCVFLWFLILLALMPAFLMATVSLPGFSQTMPPHPRLRERIARGEVKLPRFMTDPALAQSLGIESPKGRKGGRSKGTINALAVVVEFSDNARTVTATYFDTMIFEAPKVGRGSVRDYFDEVSYGQIDIYTMDMPSSLGWRTAPQTYAYYVNGQYCTDGLYPNNCRRLAEDIVDQLQAQTSVNFSNYDNDGDGNMEPIMLIHAGPGAEFTGNPNDAWSHSWSLANPRNYDGVTIADYVIMPEYWQTVSPGNSDMTIGVFAHEMGHGFWDLPDLYDRDSPPFDSEGIGRWSLMASGSWNGPSGLGSSPAWPDAWSRIEMGVVTPTNIVANVTGRGIPQVLDNPAPVETVLKLNSPTLASQEYFLLENRQQVAGAYDEYLPGNGLFIWHVDEAMNVFDKQNDYECTSEPHCNCNDTYHYLVALEQADGLHHMESNVNRGDAGDPFPGSSNNRNWTNATDPESSSWYACGDTCIRVTNISDSGATMTVDLQVVCVTTWIGNTTSWSSAGNWSDGVPDCSRAAVIPTSPSGGNWPIVDADVEVGHLTIETGAQITMTANTLGVCGNWDVQGTGRFNGIGGTVVFKGNSDQTINMTAGANGQFYNLQIGDGSSSQTVIANSNLDVDGNLTIMSNASFGGGTATIYVAGNWTTSGTFVPGSSMVVFDNTTQTAENTGSSTITVYSNDFSDITGWTVYNANGDGTTWYATTSTSNPNSPNSGWHGRYYYNTDRETGADDWLFSPAFTLAAGKTYTITFNYGARFSSRPERLAVYIGTTNSPAAMTTQIFDNNNVTNTSWLQGSGTFTPGSGGTYHVGFHAYSLPDRRELAVDDLVVVTAADTKLTFYNLVVNSTDRATFTSDVAVQNNLTVGAGGTMNLGTNDATVEGTVTNDGALRQTKDVPNAITTEFLHIQNAVGTIDKYYGVDIYPASGNMDATTVTVYGNQTCANNMVKRCFEITPGTSRTADVIFYYRDAEENGQEAALVWHWSGSAWEQQTFHSRDRSGVENNWVRATGIDSYSPFALGDNNPTAATLARFEATPQDTAILVQWKTATEIDLRGFNLYRSTAVGDEYIRLNDTLIPPQNPGMLLGATYTWTDSLVQPGVTYYYKLEVVDVHGWATLYGPVAAVIPSGPGYRIYLPLARK